MIFETKYVKELIELVENNHNNDLFYNIFLKNVTEYEKSGASEYEIYFNYILCKHSYDITIRPLKWKNSNNLNDLKNLNNDYISIHWYMR
jgi:hypothetical protein